MRIRRAGAIPSCMALCCRSPHMMDGAALAALAWRQSAWAAEQHVRTPPACRHSHLWSFLTTFTAEKALLFYCYTGVTLPGRSPARWCPRHGRTTVSLQLDLTVPTFYSDVYAVQGFLQSRLLAGVICEGSLDQSATTSPMISFCLSYLGCPLARVKLSTCGTHLHLQLAVCPNAPGGPTLDHAKQAPLGFLSGSFKNHYFAVTRASLCLGSALEKQPCPVTRAGRHYRFNQINWLNFF